MERPSINLWPLLLLLFGFAVGHANAPALSTLVARALGTGAIYTTLFS